VREARLHDARHTAATVLLLLGVPDRTVMGLMGWSNSSMTRRYQHITEGSGGTLPNASMGTSGRRTETRNETG